MRILVALLAFCLAGAAFMLWYVIPAVRADLGFPGRRGSGTPATGGQAPQRPPAAISSNARATTRPRPIDHFPAPTSSRAPDAGPAAPSSSPAEPSPIRSEVHWASSPADTHWPAALDRLTKHVAVNPDDVDARFELATVQIRLKLWASAITELDRVALARPDDLRVRLNRAQALRAAGRLTEARTEWDRVLDLDPQHIAARAYRGETLLDLGVWAAAESDFRAVLAEHPDDDIAALNLSLALRKLARPREALAAIEPLLVRSPTHLPALRRAAALAGEIASGSNASTADADRAVELARRGLAIDPTDEALHAIAARWSQR